MKKIAYIVTNGSEPIEVVLPHDVLIRAGNKVDLISLNNTDKVILQNDAPIIEIDYHFDDIENWEEYDAIVMPGGNGHLEFLKSSKLKKIIVKLNEKNKLICAICASSGVIGDFGILLDKEATAYPGYGNAKGVKWTNERVVITKNIITSKGPGTASDFALAIVTKLNGKEISETIKRSMFFK